MSSPLGRASLAIPLVVWWFAGGFSPRAVAAPAGEETAAEQAADEAANNPQSDDGEPPGAAAAKKAPQERHIEFFPLPLYATSPAEGSTYGVLPVFMGVDATGRTTWITAPSASWNSATKVNATFRYYSFPTTTRQWFLILAGSTHVNRSFRFDFRNVPGFPWSMTEEVQLLARRSLFYRFFGFGPDTTHADQSSYTRELALASARAGVNLAPHWNLGVRGGARWDKPQVGAVFGLPPTQLRYPGTPGLDGAALGTFELSLRFDTRDRGDYDVAGVASELHGARDFALKNGESFWRATWHTRVLWTEGAWARGAAHLYWTDESGGPRVPFYYRSALGGDTLFRGFTDDRFIDRGAWEAEFEQRFRLFTTHLFHVTADWRADPFVAVGQVYPELDSMFSRVRKVIGLGLRSFVYPNVLGRVDLAYGSDGFVAYVILGYPY
jgi:hypothetical protein